MSPADAIPYINLDLKEEIEVAKKKPMRTGFVDWVDKAPPPERPPLPLTHVTKGIIAHDVIKAGQIEPVDCPVFGSPLAYFFYGRPAYRYASGSSVKLEASCPFCFVLDGSLLSFASAIYPFDTGAFAARMYNHVLDEDFAVDDFCLGADPERPERLINTVYLGRADYIRGDRSQIRPADVASKAYEMEARAYIELIRSPGRNEPDDRIGTIEVQFKNPVKLAESLLAVIVPHTHWDEVERNPLLIDLSGKGIEIIPYEFIPGKPLEHYHTLLEIAVRSYCSQNGFLND
jgi:hypothetical protein